MRQRNQSPSPATQNPFSVLNKRERGGNVHNDSQDSQKNLESDLRCDNASLEAAKVSRKIGRDSKPLRNIRPNRLRSTGRSKWHSTMLNVIRSSQKRCIVRRNRIFTRHEGGALATRGFGRLGAGSLEQAPHSTGRSSGFSSPQYRRDIFHKGETTGRSCSLTQTSTELA